MGDLPQFVQSTAIRQTKMIAKDVRVVGDVGGEGVDRGQEEYDGLGPQNHQMRPTRFVAIRAFMAQVHGSLGPDGLQWRG